MASEERPDGTTMEGMIYNANEVLEKALSTGTNGLPKKLFEMAYGLVLISVVEAGFMFSGHVGTGIILAKKEDGSWSNPCACGLTGMGFGIIVGASMKDVVVFVMDPPSMDALTGDAGLRLSAQLELTLGPFGREAESNLGLSNKGVSSTVAIAYSKGLFAALDIKGAVIGPRTFVNKTFYNKEVSPHDVLFNDDVTIPESRVTMIDEVYQKIQKLSEGVTAEVDAAEESKKVEAMAEADNVAEEANKQPDVVEVDASVEAAKEQAA